MPSIRKQAKGLFLVLVLASPLRAQDPAFPIQAFLGFPDQFYTNGKSIDAWNRGADRRTTLWLEKEPGDKIVYNQLLVMILQTEPDKAYYYDIGTRKFVGRYHFEKEKYSLLELKDRRPELKDILEKAFPEPSGMPRVDQLIVGSKNRSTLQDPPPTAQHPSLRKSTWASSYFTAERKRVDAILAFNGDRGNYQFKNEGKHYKGLLNGVRYTSDGKQFLITGQWSLGDAEGYFRYWIAMENLNLFQGEWGRDNRIEGTWSGSRVRSE